MIRSMTGFGSGRSREGEDEFVIEIRAVNHKFCEVKARLPRELQPLETELSRWVKEKVARGGIEIAVRRTAGAVGMLRPVVDLPLARAYLSAWQALADGLGMEGRVSLDRFAEAEGVIRLEERPLEPEKVREALAAATQSALEDLLRMREREGKALAEDLLDRVERLREHARVISVESPASVEVHRARLEARIAELNQGLQIDPSRLAQEIALFADRVDVAEELTRLESHLDQFEKLVMADEPAGRKMEFLVQEMGREINTTGSKSQSAALAQRVVEMKAELERIREQVANVE